MHHPRTNPLVNGRVKYGSGLKHRTMKAKMICYTLGNVDYKTRSKFKREFFGYLDKSTYGKYTYLRDGLLSTIPHCRPVRSTVIVKNEHKSEVVDLLEKFNAKIKVYEVIVDDEELKIPQGATR